MFRENKGHLQSELFGTFNTVSAAMLKKMTSSNEYLFYRFIHCKIDENIFAGLYSDEASRPNAAINAMVSSLILMKHHDWTYEELFENIQFHLLVRLALGLDDLEQMPFCMATLFNFQNRVIDHFIKTGENLFEQVFDRLTEHQLKQLKIKANICRTDSVMVASNIRSYSRLQLLVEMILRIYRVLNETDKERYKDRFERYLGKSSGQYIYTLRSGNLSAELAMVGKLYHWIDQHLRPLYQNEEIFRIFEQVYQEHFTVVAEKVIVRSSEEMSSGFVQSPDDLDAAYREKNGRQIKGHVINVVETATPENEVNLITDVVVKPVNIDDSTILNERLDIIKDKTPEIEELHFDGGYGSEANDQKMLKHEITPVQTAIRGRKARVQIEIEIHPDNSYQVSCPLQKVSAIRTRKRWKACFDKSVCHSCPYSQECRLIEQKRWRVYYFRNEDHLKQQRHRILEKIPPERRSLRNNVEATIKEFSCRMCGRKVRVRGNFKTSLFAYGVAIGVNFGRIRRFMQKNEERELIIISIFMRFLTVLLVYGKNLKIRSNIWLSCGYYEKNITSWKMLVFRTDSYILLPLSTFHSIPSSLNFLLCKYLCKIRLKIHRIPP